VPNLLSLGGASLVCSCTFVLGFAEHMSPTNSEAPAQPYWCWSVTKQARSLNSNWATGLWQKLSRQHDAYEQLQPTRDAFETWPPSWHVQQSFFCAFSHLQHFDVLYMYNTARLQGAILAETELLKQLEDTIWKLLHWFLDTSGKHFIVIHAIRCYASCSRGLSMQA